MDENICQTCRFWVRDTGDEDEPGSVEHHFARQHGWCHRYPPPVAINDEKLGLIYRSPYTSRLYWCGEHQQATQPASP